MRLDQNISSAIINRSINSNAFYRGISYKNKYLDFFKINLHFLSKF